MGDEISKIKVEPIVSSKNRDRLMSIPFGRSPVSIIAVNEIFKTLPKDAILIRWYDDPVRAEWGIVVCSEEFRSLKEGESIPRLQARVTREIDAHGAISYSASLKDDKDFLSELESL